MTVDSDIEDRKITFFGGIMRKVGIDEIPQLFNILVGHMSFVGPRAHCADEADKCEKVNPVYSERFRVQAGLTGPSQLEGHAIVDGIPPVEMVLLDREYPNMASLFFDLGVILRTGLVPIFGQKH